MSVLSSVTALRPAAARRALRPLALLTLVASLALAGCAGTGPREGIGTVGGGIGGAVAGNAIGRAVGGNNAAILGTVIGGILGGAAGNAVGRELDEAARIRAANATYSALDSGGVGEQIVWDSDNARGYARVVDTGRSRRGAECREVEEFALIRGREVRSTTIYCRDDRGRWRAQG